MRSNLILHRLFGLKHCLLDFHQLVVFLQKNSSFHVLILLLFCLSDFFFQPKLLTLQLHKLILLSQTFLLTLNQPLLDSLNLVSLLINLSPKPSSAGSAPLPLLNFPLHFVITLSNIFHLLLCLLKIFLETKFVILNLKCFLLKQSLLRGLG